MCTTICSITWWRDWKSTSTWLHFCLLYSVPSEIKLLNHQSNFQSMTFFQKENPISLFIIKACIIAFLFSELRLSHMDDSFMYNGVYAYSTAYPFQSGIFLHIFMHVNLLHLVSNLLCFSFFGRLFEKITSRNEYVCLVSLCALLCSLVAWLTDTFFYESYSTNLGLSAIVFMVGSYSLLHYFYFFLRDESLLKKIVACLTFFALIFVLCFELNNLHNSIIGQYNVNGRLAHLTGYSIGIVYYYLKRRKKSGWSFLHHFFDNQNFLISIYSNVFT